MLLGSTFTKWLLEEKGYHLLLALFLSYICVGIFPLYSYESDAMHTIMGLSAQFNQGFLAPPIYQYEYAMQPLVYFLVPAIRYILPFLTCEQIYCGLTGLFTLIFIPLTVNLIHRLTAVAKIIILASLFLIPETMAIGMYPNTAILALLPAMIGLYSILDGKYFLSVLALAVAPLFRVDIVMIYPVVLFFFIWKGDTFAKAMKSSVLLGLAVVIIMVMGFVIMKANPLDSTLKGYESWNEKMSISKVLFAILSFYDVINFILLPIGLYLVGKRKQYRLLLLAMVPIILNHFVYRSMACATKHFLYMLPFVAIFTSIACNWIYNKSKEQVYVKYAVSIFLIIFLFGSTRIYSSSKPWRNDRSAEAQCGPVLHLYTETITPLKISFGIGAGEVLSTLDEQMLFTGNAVYPLYIHQLKKRAVSRRSKAVQYIGNRSCFMLSSSWENAGNMPSYLMDRGYLFSKKKTADGFDIILQKNGQKIVFIRPKEETNLTGALASRDKDMEECIKKIKEFGKPVLMYNSLGSHIFISNRQVEKGNLNLASGTESLYIITPNNKK